MPSPRQSVIGYGRVSTEEQESNYSMGAQRSRFETLCKQNRWVSLGFFPETGSGTSVLGRPVLCNILQRIQQGGVDALWVKETDRLSRPENLGDLSLISQTLEGHRTLLIVDSRTLDLSEDNSVLMLDFEGVLAKHFRRQLLRNMNRGKTRKAEMGRKAGGADIFGYKTNENGEYAPDPEEAKVVQLVFELVAKDYSLRQVTAELKRRGIRTKWGRETWSIAVLGSMLRNDVYLGIYRFHKSIHGKDVDGSRYMVRRTDNIIVGSREKPNHTPLVQPWLFDVAQEKLRANRKKTSIRLYMATGLLLCPECGARMHVKYSSASGYRHDKTRAAKYTCPNKPSCPQKRMLIGDTNDRLWDALRELILRPERIRDLIVHPPETDLNALKRQIAEAEREETSLKGKQERLLNLYLEGNIPQASYVVKTGQLEAESERLAQTRAALHQKIQSHGKRGVADDLVQTLRLLARSHRRFTEEQKTQVFRSIVKEAHLRTTGVELELYVQPTQNVWWKYRQKKSAKRHSAPVETVRIRAHRSVTNN